MLDEDFAWAASNIPFLDFDDAAQGSSIVLAYYFRWRVFRKHLRRAQTGGRAEVQCCASTECKVVSVESGWCAGNRNEAQCHHSQTETRPCVWAASAGRCTKGWAHQSAESPTCPQPPSAVREADDAGWVVSEFEGDVAWAGMHNTIACSAEHHLREGRWLRNQSALDSYSRFWFGGGGEPRKYTFAAAAAMYERFLVTGDAALLVALYPQLAEHFRKWVGEHASVEHGCAFGYADRDGQEHSIGGDGCRPLLQAALHAEARALAFIATLARDADGARAFAAAAVRWQRALLSLWSPARGFFVTRAVPRPPSTPVHSWSERQRRHARSLNANGCPPSWPTGRLVSSRELQGLSSPFYYAAVPHSNVSAYAGAWARLFAADGFAAKWGPRTAELSDTCYNFSTGHECTWNAPSWPFETAKTITGALTFLHEYQDSLDPASKAAPLDTQGLWTILAQYAKAHTASSAINSSAWLLKGTGTAWIGESLHPDTGVWWTRQRLYEAGRADRNRGHRYLHSTFVDLVLGALGVRPRADGLLVVRPQIPADLGIRYFALDGMRIHGRDVAVAFDQDGSRYSLGPGVHVLLDGDVVASGALGERLEVRL